MYGAKGEVMTMFALTNRWMLQIYIGVSLEEA